MDRFPDLRHFEEGLPACTHPLGVSVAGLTVGFLFPGEAPLEALRERYRPFLAEEEPAVVFRVAPGWEAYLQMAPDRFLRLEERPLGEGRLLLSHGFAAFRAGGRGVVRVSAPPGSPSFLQAVENVLRWTVADLALEHHGFVLHSAGLVREGRACLFFGPSGAGKSTVASLSPGLPLLSDDLVLLLKRGERFFAATTPFAGTLPQTEKHPGIFPVLALFRLRKAAKDRLEVLSRPLAVARLAAACPFVTVRAEREGRLIPLLEDLTGQTPVFDLHFTKSDSFWSLLESEVLHGRTDGPPA